MAKAKQAEAEPAEAPEAEGEDGASKGGFLKRLLSKKLIIMAAAGVVVLGGATGGYLFFFADKHHDEKPAAISAKPPAFYDMPEVLVNLQSVGGNRQSYLKAKIVLEVSDQKIVEDIKPVMPRVMDAFQTYLREVRSSDLEGSAGIYRLREELTRRVNLAVAPNKVNAVLFKEIIVQ